MKKLLSALLLIVFCLWGSFLYASAVAFVYMDEAGVTSGKPVMGTLVQGGVAAPASRVLPGTGQWMVGFANGDLRQATLLRMDAELDVAILKIQEPVLNQKITEAYQERIKPYLAMLSLTLSADNEVSELASEALPPGDPFGFRINGVPVGAEPVSLKAKRKKCSIKFEVVSNSTTAYWNTDVKLESDPQLSFWKRGDVETLNHVPQHTFNFAYQAYGRPLRKSKSFSIPLDVLYIKEENYQWTLTVKTKGSVFVKKIAVHFEGKK